MRPCSPRRASRVPADPPGRRAAALLGLGLLLSAAAAPAGAAAAARAAHRASAAAPLVAGTAAPTPAPVPSPTLTGVPGSGPVTPSTVPSASPTPDGTVTVSGTLRLPDGSPATGRPLLAFPTGVGSGDPGVDAADLLGLGADRVCVLGSGSVDATCRPGAVAGLTDNLGNYSLTLTAPGSVTVAAGLPAPPGTGNGPAVAALVPAGTSAVPPLRFWQPDPTVSATGDTVTTRVDWPALPQVGFPATPAYTAVVHDAGSGLTLTRPAATSPLILDSRLLEDATGEVTVTATGALPGSPVIASWVPPGGPIAGSSGAPPSRGAPCTLVTEGSAGPVVAPRCWLTDGALATPGPVGATRCAPDLSGLGEGYLHCATTAVTSVTVDLGTAQTIGLIALRGPTAVGIAVSVDGLTFTPVGRLGAAAKETPDRELHLPSGVSARYVRLDLDPGVTPPRPGFDTPSPQPSPDVAPTLIPTDLPTLPSDTSGASTAPGPTGPATSGAPDPASPTPSASPSQRMPPPHPSPAGGVAPLPGVRPVAALPPVVLPPRAAATSAPPGDAGLPAYHGDLSQLDELSVWPPDSQDQGVVPTAAAPAPPAGSPAGVPAPLLGVAGGLLAAVALGLAVRRRRANAAGGGVQ